ncbi:hypothetical protein KUW17_08730 [Leisingera aquaemixtae]|uniref:DUF6455 family protein n=1 Tax=Leisingera aquaemixtae TaxID=1396826 RepID=UPI001C98AE3A|nr:DUF6455 family protein [Leisingera aquaemixtae]MBY6066823.1 hypothetical protein [Leisingera aquaemixtae]
MKDMAAEAEGLGNIFRHLWLMRSVAEAAGVDLDRAVQDGRLSGLDYARMVTGCRGAGCSKSCALWLSSRRDDAPAVPEFCPSADVFKRLMP